MTSEQVVPPKELRELVARFHEHHDIYCSARYNKAQARCEFIDPLFALLGWDMENNQGLAEQYKDVIHEDAIKVSGVPKAPDYCFRHGGVRKFFVEAKKPSVNIKEDATGAYQVRRYAWSNKLPLSVLTDFEEFSVYDCRVRPEKTDPAATGRLLYIRYDQYDKRWPEIATIFSRSAIPKGAFDKFADSTKGKRGTAEVDNTFLSEIECWRDSLARNLALRNPGLTQRELNFAVQRTIDRIIFLRICEDRGIEPYGQLQEVANAKTNTYASLCSIFDRADDRYNSGLFHFHPEQHRLEPPDELSKGLILDDKILKDILKRLYYPDSPYEFSVLPADILGQVYEQFLGKVIRLTAGHQARVEEKPEVKKAGGVYYTPTHIVDYIVGQTVGKLLEGKTPRHAAWLKVLDPACGSGSFLIGAYQCLLDWHLKYYIDDGPEKHAKGRNPVLASMGSGWKLTTGERKRILLANIYGVDIDSQAVEVTKLSLLLKVLEGESQDSLNAQIRMFRERALPDLGNNIKCGNSLIGTDFCVGQQLSLLDEDAMYRINIFDWNSDTDGFGEIMKAGGFDAVIGNPPYIFGEYHDQNAKNYFTWKFASARGQYDTYWLFIEQGVALTRTGGYFSLIIPDALLARDEASVVRTIILQNGLDRVFHCGLVFKAAVSAVVFITHKGTEPSGVISETQHDTVPVLEHHCSRGRFLEDKRYKLLVHMSDSEASMLKRVAECCKDLGGIAQLSRGEELGKNRILRHGAVPILVGEDVTRYYIRQPSRFVEAITKDERLYTSPKIVIVKTGASCVAALDTDDLVTLQSLYNLHLSTDSIQAETIVGLLNSRFVRFYIRKTFTEYKLLFPQMNQSTIESIPVPVNSHHNLLVIPVRQMLDMNKRLRMANTEHEKTALTRQIAATDRHIDRLVYELYSLTKEDISLVERQD